MDLSAYNVPPETQEQFSVIFRKYRTIVKEGSSSKIIRKILIDVAPWGVASLALPHKEGAMYFRQSQFLFEVSEDTKTVLNVYDFHELRIESARILKQMDYERELLGIRRKSPSNTQPPLPLEKLLFTNHALARFSERFPAHASFKGPEHGAKQLFRLTSEKSPISKPGVVSRLIDSQFREARYFRAGRCRFVVKALLGRQEGQYLILTIEIDKFRKG